MEEEIKGEYRLIGYIDDLEDISRIAQKENLSEKLVGEIESIHDSLIELEPLLKTEAHYECLRDEVEGILNNLYQSCKDGDDGLSQENLKKLRDRLTGLKESLL